jgi:hypothetical protein
MVELVPHLSIAGIIRERSVRARHHFLLSLCIAPFISAVASGQTASLRGQVVDQSGAIIPKAAVTLTAPCWTREQNGYGRKRLLFLCRFNARPVHSASSSSKTGTRTRSRLFLNREVKPCGSN